jgi:hypothetical protein
MVMAQRAGGLAVDHEMKLRGLLDRQLGGPRALENLVYLGGGTVKEIGKVLAIAHQPAGDDVLALCKHRRQPVAEREFGDSLHLPEENSILRNHDRWHARCRECGECVLDFLRAACLNRYEQKAATLQKDTRCATPCPATGRARQVARRRLIQRLL